MLPIDRFRIKSSAQRAGQGDNPVAGILFANTHASQQNPSSRVHCQLSENRGRLFIYLAFTHLPTSPSFVWVPNRLDGTRLRGLIPPVVLRPGPSLATGGPRYDRSCRRAQIEELAPLHTVHHRQCLWMKVSTAGIDDNTRCSIYSSSFPTPTHSQNVGENLSESDLYLRKPLSTR